MTDNNTTVWISIISASSAILGIVITQIITARNNRKSDDRKYKFEMAKTKLLRKIEVGESFYHLSGENLQITRTYIHFLKSKSIINSDISNDFLEKSNEKIAYDFDKILNENPLANLVNLYYKVNTTFDSSSKLDTKTKNHYINIIEINSEILKTNNEVYKQKLSEKVAIEFIALCEHYEHIIEQTKADMEIVRNELNRTHSII